MADVDRVPRFAADLFASALRRSSTIVLEYPGDGPIDGAAFDAWLAHSWERRSGERCVSWLGDLGADPDPLLVPMLSAANLEQLSRLWNQGQQIFRGGSGSMLTPTADGLRVCRVPLGTEAPLRDLAFVVVIATLAQAVTGRAIASMQTGGPGDDFRLGRSRALSAPDVEHIHGAHEWLFVFEPLLNQPTVAGGSRWQATRLARWVDACCEAGETPTLQAAAQALCVSPRSLQRRLSEAGTTLTRLAQRVRLGRAVRCLVQGLPQGEAASGAGFWDASHLRRSIQAHTGLAIGDFIAYAHGSDAPESRRAI